MIKKALWAGLFLFIFIGNLYSQALDIPFIFGAKHNAMAGAGSAHVKGGTSIAMNPAGLAEIKDFEAEITVTNMYMELKAPVNGPGTRSTTKAYYPLMFFGMGKRLNDLLTAGFLVYTPSGGGAVFHGINVGDPYLPRNDFNGKLAFVEFGPCLAVNLPWGFKLGFVYRFNYIEQWASMYDVSMLALKTYNYSHLRGYGMQGVRAGIQWHPIDQLHIGASFRTRVVMDIKGDSRVTIAQDNVTSALIPGLPVTGLAGLRMTLPTASTARYAEMMTAGITYEYLKDTVFLSFDYSRAWYSCYKSITVQKPFPMMIPVKAKDTDIFRFGAELWINKNVPLRFGIGHDSGCANEKYHNYRTNGAPAPAYYFGIGTGYRFEKDLEINIAFNYMVNTGRVGYENNPFPYSFIPTGNSYTPSYNLLPAQPGYYSSRGYFGSIEAKYSI